MARKTNKKNKSEETEESVDSKEEENTEMPTEEAQAADTSADASDEIAKPTVFSKTKEDGTVVTSGALSYKAMRKNEDGEEVPNDLASAMDDLEAMGWNVKDVPHTVDEENRRLETDNPKRKKNQRARDRRKKRKAAAAAAAAEEAPSEEVKEDEDSESQD